MNLYQKNALLRSSWKHCRPKRRKSIAAYRRNANYPKEVLKKLVNTDDIWEVRIVFGNNIFRILSFFDGPKLIVLNNAFQKKTQKTPLQAIKTAEKRKRDYFKRRNNK